jgi:hypothetical protein
MQNRRGIICFVALSCFLLCGATSPTSCNSSQQQIGPSTGEVVGAAVGIVAVVVVGTVVLVEVNKSHHNLKGCVTAGPDGLTLHTEGNSKVYALTGVPANVKVGDVIRVHGSKSKGQKDSAGDQDFAVEKMSRDYGPCTALLAPPAGTAAPSAAPSTAP